MNRKNLIICICLAAALLGLICLGVAKLYNADAGTEKQAEVSHAEVLAAVPSDAAAVMCFDSGKDAMKLFTDATKCFGTLLSGNTLFRAYVDELAASGDMKSLPTAVSLHFEGVPEPLLAIACGRASSDTSDFQRRMLDSATDAGLHGRIARSESTSYLLISGSETLADQALRHVEGGVSILGDQSFSTLASRMPYRQVLFVDNGYAAKLAAPFLQRSAQKNAAFVKKVASWTALAVSEDTEKHLVMKGQVIYGHSPSYYFRLLDNVPAGEVKFAQIVPDDALSAVCLAIPDQHAWQKAYLDYLDASMALQKYHRNCDTLYARTGEDPAKWAASRGVKELVSVVMPAASGQEYRLNCVRFAKSSASSEGVVTCTYSGFLGCLYGDLFVLPDESCELGIGEWSVSGSAEAIAAFCSSERTLQSKADAASYQGFPAKGVHFVAYYSPLALGGRLDSVFKPVLASDAQVALKGTLWAPVTVSYTKDGLSFDVRRVMDSTLPKEKSKGGKNAPKIAKVEVPSGPFQVTNCATGKTNLLYQTGNMSICLKDEESGKGLWAVPFDKPFCGAVECIDYLANGKIQFLFAAGSRLYLIDRLGRFVTGFPVELGKEVLIGPAAYDFSGAKGYTVLALHTDNSIEMYDIHGCMPAQWKGITCEDTILGLPQLMVAESGRYWSVETAGGSKVYGFWGGEPLKAKELKNLK